MAIIEWFKTFSGMNDFQLSVFVIILVVTGSILFVKKMQEEIFKRKVIRLSICVLCLFSIVAVAHFTDTVNINEILTIEGG